MSRLAPVVKLPKLFIFVFVASIVFCAVSPAYALMFSYEEGRWPKSWPKEMEILIY